MRKSGPQKPSRDQYKSGLDCFARDKVNGHECIVDAEHVERGLPHVCCCDDPFWDDESTLRYG